MTIGPLIIFLSTAPASCVQRKLCGFSMYPSSPGWQLWISVLLLLDSSEAVGVGSQFWFSFSNNLRSGFLDESILNCSRNHPYVSHLESFLSSPSSHFINAHFFALYSSLYCISYSFLMCFLFLEWNFDKKGVA